MAEKKIVFANVSKAEHTQQAIEEMEKNCFYCIGKNGETGDIEICPMNEENCIKLHGAEWVKEFIRQLQIFIEEQS